VAASVVEASTVAASVEAAFAGAAFAEAVGMAAAMAGVVAALGIGSSAYEPQRGPPRAACQRKN
jgi:hypothetical protein